MTNPGPVSYVHSRGGCVAPACLPGPDELALITGSGLYLPRSAQMAVENSCSRSMAGSTHEIKQIMLLVPCTLMSGWDFQLASAS